MQDLHSLVQTRARARIRRSTRSLGALYRAGGLFASRMRALIWEIETRLVEAGVASTAIHPSLSSPLCASGFISPAVVYGDFASLAQAVRLASHPSAWTTVGATAASRGGIKLWDMVADSASATMRPCLVLILSLIIPIEARLSYLTLRHSAYGAPKLIDSLGGMVSQILAKMMTHELGPKDQPRLAKTLRHVAPTLEPLSLYVLRMSRRGVERGLRERLTERGALEASLTTFFEEHGDSALYSPSAWVPWLLAQEESHIVALYVKYLYDGFQ